MFKINGLSKLVDFFETKTFPTDAKVLKTTIQVGIVRYRQCASICINKEGIYLRVKMIFKSYPIIFVPWSSVKERKDARLYGLKAIQLDFHNPSIPSVKFYQTDFAELCNDSYQVTLSDRI
jgi:hypothetical protein